MARDWRTPVVAAALVLGLAVAALLTLVMLLLVAHGFSVPECVSYDGDGQRAAKVGFASTAALLVGTWIGAVLLLRRAGSRAIARLVLAAAVPLAVVAAFTAGSGLTDALVERAAPSSDSAMCW